MKPSLTLIMPTRNRTHYLPPGVAYFLASSRDDLELIVCDASDEHSEAHLHLRPWLRDVRLRLIDNTTKTTGTVSSMTENWSCALEHATGRWVAIVGDDDVCDPQLAEFISRLQAVAPQVEAVTWNKCHFDLDIDRPREAKVPMGARVMLAAGRESLVKQASWPNPKRPPAALASPYHGAVRRDVLERIKQERDGTWFAFCTPDYDLGWSISALDVPFAICERPFSVQGVSASSNSYSVRNKDKRVENLVKWRRESRELDGWGQTSDPFLYSLPLAVLGFRNAFCQRYGISANINLDNFVGALRTSLQSQEDKDSWEELHAATLRFVRQHFQQDFGLTNLTFIGRPSAHYAGLAGDLLVMPHALFNADMSIFARMAFGMVPPVEQLFSQQTNLDFEV